MSGANEICRDSGRKPKESNEKWGPGRASLASPVPIRPMGTEDGDISEPVPSSSHSLKIETAEIKHREEKKRIQSLSHGPSTSESLREAPGSGSTQPTSSDQGRGRGRGVSNLPAWMTHKWSGDSA